MTTKQLIEDIRAITLKNLEIIRETLVSLNENQKSWKQNESSWSINEIFAHLNEYAKFYHDAFKLRIENTRFTEPKITFISSPLGRSAWQSMKLGNARNIKRKFNSPKAYNPTVDVSLLNGNELSDFEKGQVELLEIIEKAEKVNLRKVKIPLSISKIIPFRLGDALMYVIYHNERHMQQALNVLANPNFPKK